MTFKMLGAQGLTLCVLMITIGCNDARVSGYAPRYVFEVEAASGEEAEILQEDTTVTCRYDRDDNTLQLSFPYAFQDANEGLFYYFPLTSPTHLRQSATVSVQVSYMGEHILILPGSGTGYINYAFEEVLPEDPRSDGFSQVSFPFYVYDLYVPAQRVCSLENSSVCRDLIETRVTGAAMWCEDTEATIENTLSLAPEPSGLKLGVIR